MRNFILSSAYLITASLFFISTTVKSQNSETEGPGGTGKIQGRSRKVKSNSSTVTMGVSPISQEPPYFELPKVDAGTDKTVEVNTGPLILNGIPYGGLWSGAGISPTGVFVPGNTCGSYRFYYSVQDLGIDSVIVSVINAGSTNPLSIAGPSVICASGGTSTFSGSPSGGTWSSNIGSGGTLSPPAAGATMTIVYSAIVETCSLVISKSLTVYPASFTLESSGNLDLCLNQSINLYFTLPVADNQQISWFRNDTLLTGEQANSLLVNQDGSYKAKVSPLENGSIICEISSNVLTVAGGNSSPPAAPQITFSGQIITTNFSPATSGFNWYRNGVLIPGEQGSTLIPIETGIYHATRKEGSCVSGFSNALIFNSLKNATAAETLPTSVFPNPVSRFLSVKNYSKDLKFTVVDMMGRSVNLKAGENGMLDFKNFHDGVYQLIIRPVSGKANRIMVIKKN
jgi:hypothetical protein